MSGRAFRVRHIEADDSGDQQTVKIFGPRGETLRKVHRVQPHGLHSNPPVGAHGLGLQFGGGSDGGRLLNVALGFEHKDYRPKNREVGSTALYDANGNMVSLVQAEVRLVGSAKVVIKSPIIVLDGKVHLGGEGGQRIGIIGTLDTGGDTLTAGGAATNVFAT